jgi:hypothetical protein
MGKGENIRRGKKNDTLIRLPDVFHHHQKKPACLPDCMPACLNRKRRRRKRSNRRSSRRTLRVRREEWNSHPVGIRE